ncbi:MAG: heavy-metal-associated domain-containing protein [Chitinophagales bacterium]|nr:heavy-metal-associated domain-containing protein [Chitinophagales bacterium]
MKSIISVLTLSLILAIGFSSCNTSGDSKQVEKTEVVSNAKLVVDVEGMTCAKGCAPLIEKAFAKKAGVAKCEVSFDDKLATIEYDDQIISEEKLMAVFPKIGNGSYVAVKKEL